MDTVIPKATAPISSLPAQRLDASGRAHVDVRAIVALAIPFAANSAIQAILNLTDTWFIGRISTSALAAIAAIHWPVIACIALFGGVGLAGQTLVAQAFGGRRMKRASQAGWMSMWAALVVAPLFWLIAMNGNAVLDPFGLDPEVQALSVQFWQPRMFGAPLGVALWGIVGFFNGIGRPRISFMVEALVCISNAVFAQLFIFELGWGIAGGAWATNCAQALGLLVALGIFVGPKMHRMFHSRLMWRPRLAKLAAQCKLGLPMGMLIAADVLSTATTTPITAEQLAAVKPVLQQQMLVDKATASQAAAKLDQAADSGKLTLDVDAADALIKAVGAARDRALVDRRSHADGA
jgi:MATE family multidrug resistance protein